MARRRDGGLLLGLALSMTLLGPAPGRAEVATDGTLGAKVRLTGKDVKIPARLGQIRGKNLFHSFERFGIETGGKATFTGPDGLKNVIGRVTGGEPSSIDGTLASTVKGADVWLLNPAGILFRPGARLQVPASFHASTADELRFEDGKVFSALDPQGSVLSVAAPEAFGFLRGRPAGIAIDQSLLAVPEGASLTLAGGDVGTVGAALVAPAGTVALAAAGTAGTVALADATTPLPGGAEIRLAQRTAVVTRGVGGGTVRIRGGRVVITGASAVVADNTGTVAARGGVTIAANVLDVGEGSGVSANALDAGNAGTVTVEAGLIALHEARIASFALASGSAGKLTFEADRIELRDRGEIASATIGAGHAGSVVVTADVIELRHGSAVASDTFGVGNAGAVTVTTRHLLADGGDSGVFTGISSATDATTVGGRPFVATGDAGKVTVSAETIELRNVGVISSATFTGGDAGEVTVAARRLRIEGDDTDRLTGITSGADATRVDGRPLISTGDGGEVTVTADTIEISRGGQIKSSTFGAGDAGEVTVKAGRLLVNGTAGSGFLTGISSGTDFVLVDGEPVLATGNAGRVTVSADAIELRSTGTISTNTLGPGGAGRVTVDAGTIELRDGGDISSTTFGAGDAGQVAVTAGRLTIAEAGAVRTDSVAASGAAGDVSVDASRLMLRRDGLIGSSGTGTGPAGNVGVAAGTLEVKDAGIRTVGSGSEGGRIEVTASDLIHLKDGEVTSNGIVPGAGASVITLKAPLIALNASRVTSLTGTGEPLAGSGLAQLFGDVTVISPDSFVAASSNVTITGLENEVGSRLAVPESTFLNAGDLLRESCAARRTGAASSFTAIGRGGLPPDPAGPLAGAYVGLDGAAAVDRAGPVLAASFGEGCKVTPGG